MDVGPHTVTLLVNLAVLAVMMRISLMKENPFQAYYPAWKRTRPQRKSDRLFLFTATVLFLTSGYFLQPTIESLLFASESLGVVEVSKNWVLTIAMASVPASIVAYVLIESRRGRKRWLNGALASGIVLTVFDLLGAAQGAFPYAGIPFCTLCNFVGGPIGVGLVLIAHTSARKLERRAKIRKRLTLQSEDRAQ
jgi:hypothetical protein